MKLNQLSIEELVELRTQMVLEKKSTTQINRVIDEKEREYVKLLLEDTSATGGPAGAVSGGEVSSGGVAFGNAAIAGMGNVVAAQPSSLPGATIGSAWSDHGGTTGSGDVSFLLPGAGKMYQKAPMGKGHGAQTGKKSREKKLNIKQLKDVFARKQDYTSGEGGTRTKKVMSFDDFQKDSMSKVTKVKENLYGINQKEIYSGKKVIGNCPDCEFEITNDDIYSGRFFCPSCGKEGKSYEIDNLND